MGSPFSAPGLAAVFALTSKAHDGAKHHRHQKDRTIKLALIYE